MKSKIFNMLLNILKILICVTVHIAVIVICFINQFWLILSIYAGLTIVGLVIVIMYIYNVFKERN